MKYCEKHNQPYMDFISVCPICRGELLAGLPTVPLPACGLDPQYIPNKCGLFLVDKVEAKPVMVTKPVQMVDKVEAKPVMVTKPVQIGLFD